MIKPPKLEYPCIFGREMDSGCFCNPTVNRVARFDIAVFPDIYFFNLFL